MSDPLDKNCSTCAFWDTNDPEHAVAAPCLLGVIARPEFWQGCRDYASRERIAAEQMTLQSQTRSWGQLWNIRG